MQEATARGVSARSLQRMKFVEKKGIPNLIDALSQGSIKVGNAEQIATLPRDQQQKALDRHLTREKERECDPRRITAKQWSRDIFKWYMEEVRPHIQELYSNAETPQFVKDHLKKLDNCLQRGLDPI
jgi:hypothetical protein